MQKKDDDVRNLLDRLDDTITAVVGAMTLLHYGYGDFPVDPGNLARRTIADYTLVRRALHKVLEEKNA